ncbi:MULTISPECIES: thioredoxin [unclassified Rhodococcus (in: high G+C Gram-positive bacteria)]|uniref:thioredoxin n=1 Tax=unclassified Rhodococcus (in: high G+C Gram-positive bacteria) TaxID=192944 RepID=UPI00092B669E|nr:thioredoxin [Rhodococcus sp. M8]OLL19241.1 thioredoxin [Rhodococcus sp. M8]QPG43063.1 thioredoxin [Rhodococcus sp. M8]
MGLVVETTDATFDADVLGSDKLVVVDFWAPWCGPCRGLAQVLDEVAAEMGEAVRVVKLNIEEQSATAAAKGIISVPTLHIYRGGELVSSMIGAKPKTEILAALEAAVSR